MIFFSGASQKPLPVTLQDGKGANHMNSLKNPNERSNVVKQPYHRLKASGFYLLTGRHSYMHFGGTTALVNVEENKVYLESRHRGFQLNKMYRTKFIGPLFCKEDWTYAIKQIKTPKEVEN